MKARVRVKRGVILSHNVWWEFVEPCIEDFFGSLGCHWVTLTSGLEGNHNFRSSHYEARSWDLRKLSNVLVRDSIKKSQGVIAKDFQRYLNTEAKKHGHPKWRFFVMFHGRPLHYHIQVVRGVSP